MSGGDFFGTGLGEDFSVYKGTAARRPARAAGRTGESPGRGGGGPPAAIWRPWPPSVK